MMELRFTNLRADRASFQHPADVFIGISAEFELATEIGVIYREVDFPVIELAAELNKWVNDSAAVGEDFEFDSMQTAEIGWLWIRRTDTGWRVGSIHQYVIDRKERQLDEVQTAIRRYVIALQSDLYRALGVRLEDYIDVAPSA